MAEFDLVLKRGVLYDGSGATPLRGDVAVRGSRIAAIGADLVGRETIDCDGLCIAPGFIDTHAHDELAALTAPALEMKVRQGVTLELLGHNGLSVAPLRTGDLARRRAEVAEFLGHHDAEWPWRSVANYLDALDQARTSVDTAYLVPHGAVRQSIVGGDAAQSASHDIFRMKGLLARSLDEGAFGLSIGMAFRPCHHAPHEELTELASVAASRHVPCTIHLRAEGAFLFDALEEAFRLGRESGAPIHVAHLKVEGAENWPQVDAIVEAISAARRAGVQVTADVYPYCAALSTLASMLPPWVHEGSPEQALRRLESAEDRPRILRQLLEPARGWDSFWRQVSLDRVLIWDLPSGKSPQLLGRDLASAAAAANREPLDFALDLLAQEKLAARFMALNQSETVLARLLALPYVAICSNSIPAGRPHPRDCGTFPRVLARYVREERALTLEAAIRKMTGLPADIFGLTDHGYLLQGKRANIVVIDAERVRDCATFEQPSEYPEGIAHVLVGGRPVVRDGAMTGERPGRVARRGRN